jgi:hypothetical protein
MSCQAGDNTHLKLQPDLWAEYASREVTRWEHLAELYRYLELSPFNPTNQAEVSNELPGGRQHRREVKYFCPEEILVLANLTTVLSPAWQLI